MQTGLQTIEGKQYYLAASGAMQTGWHNIGDDIISLLVVEQDKRLIAVL